MITWITYQEQPFVPTVHFRWDTPFYRLFGNFDEQLPYIASDYYEYSDLFELCQWKYACTYSWILPLLGMSTEQIATSWSLKITDSLPIATCFFWYMEEREQRCPGCPCPAVLCRRSDLHFLTRVTATLDFKSRGGVSRDLKCDGTIYTCYNLCRRDSWRQKLRVWYFRTNSTVMSTTEDEFSPPLEGGLQRADSNRSWTGSQERQEEQAEHKINMNTMFMLSLTTIMSLFT